MDKLTKEELAGLVGSVFPLSAEDKALAILVDIPRRVEADSPEWRARRVMAEEWATLLREAAPLIPLESIHLVAYPDVGSNNADLPAGAFLVANPLPRLADGLSAAGTEVPFPTLFQECQLFLAPTEFSTTAPLKIAAKQYGFRAATMPGFSEAMIPALKLDYAEISRRVDILKQRLDEAESAEIYFLVDGELRFRMFFDLRFRQAHTSSGRFPVKGTAGNLPSGETYIVPYEGEGEEPSRTEGLLPVEVNSRLVLYSVINNRAFQVHGEGEAMRLAREHLQREPAFGNMAELGFGVLADFGLKPMGEMLLDEKLGLHIAFGRSDHFGGAVGPQDFSTPAAVVHLDQIYIPAAQPRISVESVILGYGQERMEKILENNRYLIF